MTQLIIQNLSEAGQELVARAESLTRAYVKAENFDDVGNDNEMLGILLQALLELLDSLLIVGAQYERFGKFHGLALRSYDDPSSGDTYTLVVPAGGLPPQNILLWRARRRCGQADHKLGAIDQGV